MYVYRPITFLINLHKINNKVVKIKDSREGPEDQTKFAFAQSKVGIYCKFKNSNIFQKLEHV